MERTVNVADSRSGRPPGTDAVYEDVFGRCVWLPGTVLPGAFAGYAPGGGPAAAQPPAPAAAHAPEQTTAASPIAPPFWSGSKTAWTGKLVRLVGPAAAFGRGLVGGRRFFGASPSPDHS